MNGPPDLVELCPRCKRRHLVELPCWGGRYAQTVRELVLEIKGTTCWLCGHPGATTADHVQPRSRGGTDALANLQPAHRFCNTGRGASGYTPPRLTPLRSEDNDRW